MNLKYLLTPNKFIPVYLERKNQDALKLPPYSVELHLTSKCNLCCDYCGYKTRNERQQELPDQIVNTLLDNIIAMRVRGAYLSGGGEPTMMKGWAQQVKKLSQGGVQVALVTNGIMLREKHRGTIALLDYMAVSAHDGIKSSIPKISPSTQVGLRVVVTEDNYLSLNDIYNTAKSRGYRYVIFIPQIAYEGGKGLLQSNIDFIIKHSQVLLILPDVYIGTYPKKVTKPCWATQLRTHAWINYDGSVFLCQPRIGDKQYSIGNLYDKTLAEIWNSERHLEVIERLQTELCVNCRVMAYNVAVEDYRDMHNNHPIEVVKDCFL